MPDDTPVAETTVRFGNPGGDPFEDQATLEAFLDDLSEVATGVWIGDTEWPADDYAIHDRPVIAEGIRLDRAEAIYNQYEDEAVALASPTRADPEDVKQRADPMTNGHVLDPETGEGVCETTGGGVMGDGGMTPQQRATANVGFDVVGGPAAEIAQRADDEFDPENPPEEFREAIEADDFLIYGKASVEKVDLKGTRISVQALERALDRFFESTDAPGVISRGHADVIVGMPVREHTLETDTTLVIDGETYEFEAGEQIRTEPKDADGDDVEELWLASRLANDTDIARETRYKALTGELNGYSVTVKPKDGATRQTEDSEDILAVDLHAVTVGTDEQILNKGSEFDVAEFRAFFANRADAAISEAEDLVGSVLEFRKMGDNDPNSADEEDGGWFKAKILQRSADGQDEQPDDGDADGGSDVEQRADDDPEDDEPGEDEQEGADPVDRALSEGTIEAAEASRIREVAERMDDGGVQTLIDAISENDLDVDEAVDMIEAYNGASDEGDGGMSASDDEGAPEELKARSDGGAGDGAGAPDPISNEEIAELEERLESVGELDDRLDDIEQRLEDLSDSAATTEDVEQEIEQRLEGVAEDLDDEFSDLIQRAEVVGSPSPTAGDTDGDQTLGDVIRLDGGDDGGD